MFTHHGLVKFLVMDSFSRENVTWKTFLQRGPQTQRGNNFSVEEEKELAEDEE